MKRCCPHCGLDTVRRIRRKGRLDFLLTMMGVWPFRCQHCAYRFRRLTPAARFTKTDRREYERLPTEIGATISGKPSGECDQIVDLSMGGCRIKTQMPLPTSALLHLQLALPDRERVVTVQTAMVCCVHSDALGVQFLHMEPKEFRYLSQFVRHLLLTRSAGGRTAERFSTVG